MNSQVIFILPIAWSAISSKAEVLWRFRRWGKEKESEGKEEVCQSKSLEV